MPCFLLLAACEGPYSTLDPGGPAATDIAALWWGMFLAATLLLLGIVGLWCYAVRRSPDLQTDDARTPQRLIVGGGVLLPALGIIVLLAFGIPMGQRMLPVFANDVNVLRIDVTAHRWWWEVSYPDLGLTFENLMHIPAGQPVELHLRSTDVIHAFWVPRLGGKLDAIPGHTNVLRLEASDPGLYEGLCAEFCGLQHARMQFTVQAHAPADFEAWLRENGVEGN